VPEVGVPSTFRHGDSGDPAGRRLPAALGSPSARLANVVRAADELLDVDGVGVLLLDEHDVLRSVAATGPAAAQLEAVQLDLGVGPGLDVMAGTGTLAIDDLPRHPGYGALAQRLGGSGVCAVVSVPIRVQDELVGNLNVVKGAPRRWSAAEISAVEAFARVIAVVLEASSAGPTTGEQDVTVEFGSG
jgi:GAF domain-containing protein